MGLEGDFSISLTTHFKDLRGHSDPILKTIEECVDPKKSLRNNGCAMINCQVRRLHHFQKSKLWPWDIPSILNPRRIGGIFGQKTTAVPNTFGNAIEMHITKTSQIQSYQRRLSLLVQRAPLQTLFLFPLGTWYCCVCSWYWPWSIVRIPMPSMQSTMRGFPNANRNTGNKPKTSTEYGSEW